MVETYRAGPYERCAQRFINPLFISDGNGGYAFSSTATFVRYGGNTYCIFAAHAQPNHVKSIESIGLFSNDGMFVSLDQISLQHKIFSYMDIIICRMIGESDHINYFDLSIRALPNSFEPNRFGWIGFPKKKAVQGYHKTKSSSKHIMKDFTVLEDGAPMWKNAKFLLIGVEREPDVDMGIRGRFSNKDVQYKFEGFKQQGYSLRGMSGGALFHYPKEIESLTPLTDLFFFIGIGLQYDGNLVKGTSRQEILSVMGTI